MSEHRHLDSNYIQLYFKNNFITPVENFVGSLYWEMNGSSEFPPPRLHISLSAPEETESQTNEMFSTEELRRTLWSMAGTGFALQ